MNITILLAVSEANFAMGFMAAAFFGYGPSRLHKFVQWVNGPPLTAPRALNVAARNFKARLAARRTSTEQSDDQSATEE
ncbi:MAG: hypothetical protein VB878_04995 [Pirellulaceae bacterium]